jgi:hypothetical protein
VRPHKGLWVAVGVVDEAVDGFLVGMMVCSLPPSRSREMPSLAYTRALC